MFTKETGAIAGKKGGSQPKKRDMITQHIISELTELHTGSSVSRARMLARALVDNAVGGDLQAQKEVIDRVEGKARQEIDVNHDGEITLKSAAVSVLDEIVEFAAGRSADIAGKDSLPN